MTTTATIPAAVIHRYRGYRSEYQQADALHKALLLRDRRRELTPYEVRTLSRAEDDAIYYGGLMRRMEQNYPGIAREDS